MEKKYLQLNDVPAYKVAFNLSNYVWEIVIKWDWFAKKHVGGQFIEAADSISAPEYSGQKDLAGITRKTKLNFDETFFIHFIVHYYILHVFFFSM